MMLLMFLLHEKLYRTEMLRMTGLGMIEYRNPKVCRALFRQSDVVLESGIELA